MRIIDIISSPWAIIPSKYAEICGIYARHLLGEKVDLAALEAKMGHPLQNIQQTEIYGSVAVVPVHGVLAKKANMLQKISGGTSMELISRDFNAAMESDQIKTILLDVDSPGGTVAGTELLSDMVYKARANGKKIIAVANETMASAAYWIASAADEIYIASSTSEVGSIGVVTEHTDTSEAQAAEGIKKTVIHAGKYKAVGHSNAPLSEDDKGVIQAHLDYTYSIFVNAVARNRGVSAETVLADMADGRIFIGQQAIDAGLVDGVSTLGELIAKYSNNVFSASETTNIIDYLEQDLSGTNANMTTINKAYLALNHADLLAEIQAEATAAVNVAEIQANAANTERERIASILNLPMASAHKDLIHSLAFDGKTTKAEAALALLDAESKRKDTLAASHKADGEALLAIAPSAVAEENVVAMDAEITGKGDEWDNSAELRAEFHNDRAAFDAYKRAIGGNLVRQATTKV